MCLFLIYIHSLFLICDIRFPSTAAREGADVPSTFLWIWQTFATLFKAKYKSS